MSYGGVLRAAPGVSGRRAFTTAIQLSESRGLLEVTGGNRTLLRRIHIPVACHSPSDTMESGHPDSNRDRPLIKRELCL